MTLAEYRGVHGSFIAEDDPFPRLRSALAPEYAELAPEDVEALLARNGINAAAMEAFFDWDAGKAFSSVGKAIRGAVSSAAPAVAQVAGRALPGIVSGAATGAALGPWGALGGALLGGVTSALSGSAGQPGGAAARPGGAPGPAGALGSIASAALPAVAGLVGGGGNPAGALLGLLQRPEVLQSLMSLALGPAGRKNVPVGASGTPVPVSAFANLLSILGSRAFGQAEASAAPSEALPSYLYKEGALVVDPADPVQRAAHLLEMLGEAAAIERSVPRRKLTEADEYYDAIDIAELDESYMEGNALEFDD